MKEKPILMTDEEVRAILDGRKTQTRRVVKPQPNLAPQITRITNMSPGFVAVDGRRFQCPYGQPGDRLWVQETWRPYMPPCFGEGGIVYRADDGFMEAKQAHDMVFDPETGERLSEAWWPSSQMPRWASRLTLEVTEVHVERVEEISEFDCLDEGCPHISGDEDLSQAMEWFSDLWDSTYAKRGLGWDVNPWVWVVTFKL